MKSPFAHLKGRNLMLCDVNYQSPSKMTEYSDYLSVVYKDLITDEKSIMNIKDPMITIYEVKPEYRTFKRQRNYVPLEKLIPHDIKYKDRYHAIAKIAEKSNDSELYNMRFFNEHKREKERRQLYKYGYVVGADIPIETYYRVLWYMDLDNDLRKKPDPLFMDIEVDQKGYEGPMARKGECPVNAVSVMDDKNKIMHTFLYKTPENPQIEEFCKKENIQAFQQVLHATFDESYGSDIKYQLYAFESEVDMLQQLFRLVHSLKRDFALFWNMGYDIPYIIGRLEALGYNPADFMCHTDFPTQRMYYYEDTNTFEFSAKRDFFDITSYTHYLDQLIMYASLRKSQGAMRKVNLGAVGQKELKDTKLDYTDVGNFIEFPYIDYPKFVLYNIKDVLLQYGINRKCNDVETYYQSCLNSFCGYKDGLKQTVSLRAFIYAELLLKHNMVLGHNINFDNVKNTYIDEEGNEVKINDKFEGALNGNPMLNDYMGLELFGKRSMFLFGGCIDFDFSAMYPNSICAFNIFADCMIGKLEIEAGDVLKTYDDDAGKEFIEDMVSQLPLHTGKKWFDLPDIMELDEIIKRELCA